MISESDPFLPILYQFLNINYEIEQRFPESGRETKAIQPLTFFDRHIGTDLQLKTIKPAPWIPKVLGHICEEAIKDFTASGHTFVANRKYWEKVRSSEITLTTANYVAQYHFSLVTLRGNAFASKLLFHPDDPEWVSLLINCARLENMERQFRLCYGIGLADNIKTDTDEKTYQVPSKLRHALDDRITTTLSKFKTGQRFLNYEFYIKTKQSEDLLAKMSPCADFKWESPMTTGASVVPSSAQQSDSRIITSLFPALVTSPNTRKKLAKESKQIDTTKRGRKVVPPLEKTEFRQQKYRMNVNHYIQKAWTTAVETDVSFIVFSCGRSERIGIRHRETQTLYLSDLIDPTCIKEYGQMHLGLVLAAVKDQLDKTDMKAEPKARSRKRARDSLTGPTQYNSMKDKATRRKRRRLNPDLELTSPELDRKTFDHELAQRDLVLLYLNDSIYQSPKPSSFRRMEPSCTSRPFNGHSHHFKRKQAYHPQSYISVTANGARLGQGAVGFIYRVTADIEMASSPKHQRDLILKLAVGPNKNKILEEYKYYKHLAEADVTRGIVSVHGLFQDMETGTLMMLMEDAGKSLRTRADELGGDPVNDRVLVTREECDAFEEVLEGIHNTGITHTDLRIDNLMINQDGEVFVIDFDCAEIYDHRFTDLFKRDMGEMLYAIGWGYSSSDDSDSN